MRIMCRSRRVASSMFMLLPFFKIACQFRCDHLHRCLWPCSLFASCIVQVHHWVLCSYRASVLLFLTHCTDIMPYLYLNEQYHFMLATYALFNNHRLSIMLADADPLFKHRLKCCRHIKRLSLVFMT